MTEISDANVRRARELAAKLTLDEKIGMIHGAGLFRTEGVPRLGIPPFRFDDGPMGVRAELENDNWAPLYNTRDYVTYLPSGSAVASTWNTELARETGKALGEEARGRGKDMILGPSINIKRAPLCGRNFEYMSEDPMLTAAIAVPFVDGVQASDVSACPKHFAANSQETDRLDVDESISERALRELYLPAFRAVVEDGGTLSVMGAYNLVNGTQCCESSKLLDDILRDEWGFRGFVVSDWSAVKNTERSARVGLDCDMGVTNNFDDYYFARPLREAVLDGTIPEADVTAKVEHILAVMDALHMLPDREPTDESFQYPPRKPGSYATLEHAKTALDVARESIVLLKNDDHLLPLNETATKRLLVVGANADRTHSNGGGSAVVKAVHEITPILGLNGMLGGNVHIDYAPGYYAKQVEQDAAWQEESLENSALEVVDAEREAKRLHDEAVALARDYAASGDPIVFIGGLDHDFDIEGRDRESMALPYGQDDLIAELLDIAPDMIVVIVAGSPVEMPWGPRVRTLVWNWYDGCEGGRALAETLFGRVTPSGHLPETFPVKLSDCPAISRGTFGQAGHVSYDEDIFVGYRYYESFDVPVAFCFGHGLSYTTFDYSDLRVRRLSDGRLRFLFHVENTGAVVGAAVPQLYLGLEDCGGNPARDGELDDATWRTDRPAKELKAFAKVWLEPGERREVHLDVTDEQAFGYWNVDAGWFALAPSARVHVGESVQDIRLEGRVER
ncbi:beta-glucosidase [Bifidobacterium choloepi]|uniref:Glycosyl hydrolase n=1 Tax=Bifidobacterium choloepi TaxID=2614131 RepID=A0A6I5NH01_9BIFI|nr:glycoside hydrolase family 3 C-terminal domain-containing protein [Bifidobacterium choloepi]NEG70524.1 glycosyl hydrolase [Bifidobacterium choloepi]